jgi:CheY-like chemotaxis protein
MAKTPALIRDEDVYVLSDRGDKELRGAETSLSPAEIELLVRIDGSSTVARIAAEVKLLARHAVIDAFLKLRDGGLIRLNNRGDLETDGMIGFFDASPRTTPARKTSAATKAEASEGASSLQKQGYFVRIARRGARGPTLAQGKTLSAIIVEDEPHLAKFLAQYLAFEGFETRIAANREQVVCEFHRSPPPDLVLLDVMLPDADGFDILFRMRQHPVLKAVPVIMLTAKATRESVLKGLAGGADGYITKPFEPDALVTAIKTIMGPAGKTSKPAPGLKRT